MNKALLYLFLTVLIIVVGFFAGSAFFYDLGTPRVYEGVYLDGHHLGGMTESEVSSFLTALDRSVEKEDLVLGFEGESFNIEPSDIGFGFDVEGLTEEIMGVGRKGSLIERLKFRIPYLSGEKRLVLRLRYDKERLQSILDEIAASVYIPPKDPEPDLTGGGIHPEVMGRRLVIDEALRRIDRILMDRGGGKISLPVEELHPARRLKELTDRGIVELISSYSTEFDPDRKERVENIRLASAKIDGVILEPGEIFSFNERVGPRTIENGYKVAPEIVKNRLVTGVGGGVCQVSSTLYNTVLFGGLWVTERRNHSIPLDYIPLGRDATVYYPAIDFKFVNSLDGSVMLVSRVEGRTLTIGIFGTKEDGVEVRLVTSPARVIKCDVHVEYDPSLSEDEVIEEAGADGYSVTLYREIYHNGRKRLKEEVAESYYPPRDRVVRVRAPEEPRIGEPGEQARLD